MEHIKKYWYWYLLAIAAAVVYLNKDKIFKKKKPGDPCVDVNGVQSTLDENLNCKLVTPPPPPPPQNAIS